jgi:hypothetical protein
LCGTGEGILFLNWMDSFIIKSVLSLLEYSPFAENFLKSRIYFIAIYGGVFQEIAIYGGYHF